jgi:hypothetical protein
MKATYVLFVPGMRPPSVYHESLASAREEANRLVSSCGSDKVMICRFTECIQRKVEVVKSEENPLMNSASEPLF